MCISDRWQYYKLPNIKASQSIIAHELMEEILLLACATRYSGSRRKCDREIMNSIMPNNAWGVQYQCNSTQMWETFPRLGLLWIMAYRYMGEFELKRHMIPKLRMIVLTSTHIYLARQKAICLRIKPDLLLLFKEREMRQQLKF